MPPKKKVPLPDLVEKLGENATPKQLLATLTQFASLVEKAPAAEHVRPLYQAVARALNTATTPLTTKRDGEGQALDVDAAAVHKVVEAVYAALTAGVLNNPAVEWDMCAFLYKQLASYAVPRGQPGSATTAICVECMGELLLTGAVVKPSSTGDADEAAAATAVPQPRARETTEIRAATETLSALVAAQPIVAAKWLASRPAEAATSTLTSEMLQRAQEAGGAEAKIAITSAVESGLASQIFDLSKGDQEERLTNVGTSKTKLYGAAAIQAAATMLQQPPFAAGTAKATAAKKKTVATLTPTERLRVINRVLRLLTQHRPSCTTGGTCPTDVAKALSVIVSTFTEVASAAPLREDQDLHVESIRALRLFISTVMPRNPAAGGGHRRGPAGGRSGRGGNKEATAAVEKDVAEANADPLVMALLASLWNSLRRAVVALAAPGLPASPTTDDADDNATTTDIQRWASSLALPVVEQSLELLSVSGYCTNALQVLEGVSPVASLATLKAISAACIAPAAALERYVNNVATQVPRPEKRRRHEGGRNSTHKAAAADGDEPEVAGNTKEGQQEGEGEGAAADSEMAALIAAHATAEGRLRLVKSVASRADALAEFAAANPSASCFATSRLKQVAPPSWVTPR